MAVSFMLLFSFSSEATAAYVVSGSRPYSRKTGVGKNVEWLIGVSGSQSGFRFSGDPDQRGWVLPMLGGKFQWLD